LVDITADVCRWLAEIDAADGLLTLFLRHTSASLLIQENADPDVLADLVDALARLAPEGAAYRHRTEGPDDMPAHIKAALTAVSLSVPIHSGRPMLGTWQAIYVAEHRAAPHKRETLLHFVGTFSDTGA
jgi:secondary thiamine-phosphate synthase enzyme